MAETRKKIDFNLLQGITCPHSTAGVSRAFPVRGWRLQDPYALSEPIPCIAPECSRAATVHIGGSLEEIVELERNFTSDRPFVLLGQPSMFDPIRASVGQASAQANHKFNGYDLVDKTGIINDDQRFASRPTIEIFISYLEDIQFSLEGRPNQRDLRHTGHG